jgi:predicted transcriptional regulator of viral defense system
MIKSLTRKHLEAEKIGVFFRPRDIARLGISFRQLKDLVSDGEVEKVGKGLYRLAKVELTEAETVAMAACAIPRGIICLLTALAVHEIGTQIPHEIWIGIDRKSRKPAGLPTRVRIVRFSGAMLTYGIIHRRMLGVSVAITSPARTVVDCFRYRNKVGTDIAMEALRDAIRSRKATVDEISRTAEVCRIRTVIAPYLEAISA